MLGWVDLWRGIVLCDVLCDQPTVRGVPVPFPMDLLRCNNGRGRDLGCPEPQRGIASFIDHDKPDPDGTATGTAACPCLRFVQLKETSSKVFPDEYDGTWDWAVHDWAITTWSNYKMTASYEDWHMDCCKVRASDTAVDSKLKSMMLNSGLLRSSPPPSPPGGAGGAEARPERSLQNLLVSYPALGMDDGVVYLQARAKFLDPKVFVIALDTRNKALLGAVKFTTEREPVPGNGIFYFPSNISRYIDPEDRVLRISEGDEDDDGSIFEG